jgi:serine/threonine protein kinase
VYGTGNHAYKVVNFRHTPDSRCNLRELVFLHSMHHPNIIRPLRSQVVMVHGKFARVIHQLPAAECSMSVRGVYTMEEAAGLLSGVLKALRYCHANGIVHGDVKPDNILAMPDGSVVLADLSVTSFRCDDDCLVPSGSLYWRPPECLARELYTEPSDIWSLGVAALDCLHGCVYFRDKRGVRTARDLRRMLHGVGGLVDESMWSAAGSRGEKAQCADLLRQMLQLQPSDRATADELLAHPFLRPWYTYTAPEPPVLSLHRNWKVVAERVCSTLDLRGVSFDRAHVHRLCMDLHCFLWGCVPPPEDNGQFCAGIYHVLHLLDHRLVLANSDGDHKTD